jgi:hypothetical protein
MLAKTIELRNQLIKKDALADKLDILKDTYKGETAYLLTCGPSFGDYSAEFYQKTLRDKLVISVKQTYESVRGITDFHLLNAWNYKKYSYEDPQPVVLFENHPTHPDTPGLEPDLHFMCTNMGKDIPKPERLAKRLCTLRNFDDYLFDSNPDRPWGPGIVYELAFYLAVHIGVEKIIAVGWDIGSPDSRFMPHFYKEGANQELTNMPVNLVKGDKLLNFGQDGKISESKLDSQAESLVNVPGYYEDEVAQIAASTGEAYDWLLSHGVELEIASECSIADARIPRVKL